LFQIVERLHEYALAGELQQSNFDFAIHAILKKEVISEKSAEMRRPLSCVNGYKISG